MNTRRSNRSARRFVSFALALVCLPMCGTKGVSFAESSVELVDHVDAAVSAGFYGDELPESPAVLDHACRDTFGAPEGRMRPTYEYDLPFESLPTDPEDFTLRAVATLEGRGFEVVDRDEGNSSSVRLESSQGQFLAVTINNDSQTVFIGGSGSCAAK